MSIGQQRNAVVLIGNFRGIEYEGAKVNVMEFEDERHGRIAIGVLKDETITLNVPYRIEALLKGSMKKYSDGRTFNRNFLILKRYEKIETNKNGGTK